ncbi:hypothetical protein PN685_004259 [Salmonella enterica]|nr:hypothetical protein [Salmonella enterica]
MSVTNAKPTRSASKASKKTTSIAQAEAANTALRDIPVTMIAVNMLVKSALMKKPQVIDALNEAGQTGAARDADKMKKGDAAEQAEIKMANNRWVPVWMCAPDAQYAPSDAENSVSDASTNPVAHAA